MGMMMSLVGMDKVRMPQSPQMLKMATGMLYEKFTKNRIQNFEEFHEAMLDMFNVINSVLPGRHYDVPARTEIEECFEEWKNSSEGGKRVFEGYKIPSEEGKRVFEGYKIPSEEGTRVFEEWKNSSEERKKNVFVNFMTGKVNLSKLDNSTVITGLVTPPAAMAAKKAGENVPQMGIIKAIPDVIFVPSITVLALISAKFYRKVIQGPSAS